MAEAPDDRIKEKAAAEADPKIYVVVNGQLFPRPSLQAFFARSAPGEPPSKAPPAPGCTCHPVAGTVCTCMRVCPCVGHSPVGCSCVGYSPGGCSCVGHSPVPVGCTCVGYSPGGCSCIGYGGGTRCSCVPVTGCRCAPVH